MHSGMSGGGGWPSSIPPSPRSDYKLFFSEASSSSSTTAASLARLWLAWAIAARSWIPLRSEERGKQERASEGGSERILHSCFSFFAPTNYSFTPHIFHRPEKKPKKERKRVFFSAVFCVCGRHRNGGTVGRERKNANKLVP